MEIGSLWEIKTYFQNATKSYELGVCFMRVFTEGRGCSWPWLSCWCGWSSCAGPCLSCLRCVAAITVRQSTLDWDGARQQSHWPLTPQSAVTVIMIHYHITSLHDTIRQNDSFGNPLTNNSPASIFLTKQSCRLFTARLSPRWFWLHSQ